MRALAMLAMLAGGCTISVDIITKVDTLVRFDPGAATSCSGSSCRIDLAWEGPIFDARKLREKVDAQIRDEGYDPAEIDISVDAIDVTVQAVVIADGGQAIAPERIPSWSAELGIAGTQIAAFQGQDVTTLLEVPRTFPMPETAVDECEDAFEEGRVVMGDGSASLLLRAGDVPPAPGLVFEIRAVVYATASKRIL